MSPLDLLRSLVSPASILTEPDLVEGYRRDQATWAPAGHPLAVVRPASTGEVQALARWASQHRIAIVPRGAGSGLSGGAAALDGCIVLSFERMNRLLSIDPLAMTATVQPGLLNGDLKRAAREQHLWYPPDPSSADFSTLGGNVSTNAGGLCCLKYGVTADYVLGLEVVLADGTRLRTGGKTRKNVAGYDMTRLFVGSEGTLGIITEITLRLRPLPPPATTLVAYFDTLASSGEAVAQIVRGGAPSMLEIMDRASLAAVEAYKPLGLELSAAALLLGRSDVPGSDELSRMQRACEQAGASLVYSTEDEAEGEQLLAARRLAYTALEHTGTVLVDDVAVSLPDLPEMMRRIETIAARTETRVATVAHAGDGNLHPFVVFDRADPAAEARAVSVFEEIMSAALALGGTITGEHGVGLLKRDFLARQLGPELLAVERRVKQALDPLQILNPGKVI